MKRTNLSVQNHTTAIALDVIGDRWSLLIVQDALRGVCRFDEFQRSLGVARNILSVRLKALVADGILDRIPIGIGNKRAKYCPTTKGLGLAAVLMALNQWSECHEQITFSLSTSVG